MKGIISEKLPDVKYNLPVSLNAGRDNVASNCGDVTNLCRIWDLGLVVKV